MSPATSSYDTVKLTTDSNQLLVAHLKLQLAFQSHIAFARKLQNYSDAFSNSSRISNIQNTMFKYLYTTEKIEILSPDYLCNGVILIDLIACL